MTLKKKTVDRKLPITCSKLFMILSFEASYLRFLSYGLGERTKQIGHLSVPRHAREGVISVVPGRTRGRGNRHQDC